MEKRYEMRFSGSGGQGVILASVIFAEAAIISGINAIQSQAYGPEARGGLCKAETIVSEGDIWFSKVTKPLFLLSLTQASLNQFAPSLTEGGIILADAGLKKPEGVADESIVFLPILATASEVVGKAFTANIVAVGAINKLLGLFSEEVLNAAVMRHVPKGTEALNTRALEAGRDLVSEELAAKHKAVIS